MRQLTDICQRSERDKVRAKQPRVPNDQQQESVTQSENKNETNGNSLRLHSCLRPLPSALPCASLKAQHSKAELTLKRARRSTASTRTWAAREMEAPSLENRSFRASASARPCVIRARPLSFLDLLGASHPFDRATKRAQEACCIHARARGPPRENARRAL